MNPSLDDFINYDNNNTDPFRNDFPDFGFGLSSPDSHESDLFRNVPSYMPKTIQNMLEQVPPTNDNGLFFNFSDLVPTNTQFVEGDKNQTASLFDNYTPVEHTDYSYSPNTQDDNESVLNKGSKKITKREKAKLKAQAKKEALQQMLDSVDKKYIPPEFYDPNLDEESKKKMIQVIRNRVSAQASRDKKKAQVAQLQDHQSGLYHENVELKRQNELLLQQLQQKEEECRSLAEQIEALKRKDNSMCLKCGTPSDFGDSQHTTEDNTSGYSSASSPLLYRAGGRKGAMFGFGVGFTTLMCFLMLMGSNSQSGNTRTNLVATKNYITKYYGNNDNSVCRQEPTSENVQYKDRGFNLDNTDGDASLLARIKPLVEKFESFHNELYKNYEKNQVVVDLSSRKFEHVPNKITRVDNKRNDFLGKNTTKGVVKNNHTATLLMTSGVEVQRNESNKPFDTNTVTIQEEIVDEKGMLQNTESVGVDKADFVQLFIPRHALGQLNGAENLLNKGNFPIIEEGSEGSEDSANSLIEVWAKIFAVRDIGSI